MSSKTDSNNVVKSVVLSNDLLEVLSFLQGVEHSSFAHVVRKTIWEGSQLMIDRLDSEEKGKLAELVKEKGIKRIKNLPES